MQQPQASLRMASPKHQRKKGISTGMLLLSLLLFIFLSNVFILNRRYNSTSVLFDSASLLLEDAFQARRAPSDATSAHKDTAQERSSASQGNSSFSSTQNETKPIEPLSCRQRIKFHLTTDKETGEPTLHQGSVFANSRWGNVLSPYWGARTMAELGGYKYHLSRAFGRGTWMEYLPTVVPAREPRPDRFYPTCDYCDSYEYFHRCGHGWGAMRPTIIKDTRAAIQKFFQAHPEETPMKFEPTDWLIYERCCIFCNMIQGFSNVRAYDVLPTNGSYTVYTMSPPNTHNIEKKEGHSFCNDIEELRDKYIRDKYPNVRIVPLKGGSLFNDWAKLVYAPNLLIPSLGTTFGLWAGMANAGNVYLGKPNTNEISMKYNDPMYPPDLHILNVPWLGPPTAFDELHLDKSIPEPKRDDYRTVMRDSPEGTILMRAWFLDNATLPVYRPKH